MSRNNDYTTGDLSDYLYFWNYHKLTGIDLSKQRNTSNPKHIFLSLRNRKNLFETVLWIY